MKRRENNNLHNIIEDFPYYFNMNWEPLYCDNDLTSLGQGSSFFLQQYPGKHLLLIHESELTSVVVLKLKDRRLVVDCVKDVPSKRSVFTITGNDDCIIMLDVEEELYYLQGTVGYYVDCLNRDNANYFLNCDGELSWQRRHELTNCLAMTGITDAVSFLYHYEAVHAAHYRTADIQNGLCEISNKRLSNYFLFAINFFVAKLKGEVAKIVGMRVLKSSEKLVKEVLLVIDSSHICFIIPNPDGLDLSEPYPIDLEGETVINVLTFQKKNWILIICESGKIIYLMFSKSSKSIQVRHDWLSKPVTAVAGYEDDMMYFFIWSDANNLYMAKLDEDNMIIDIHFSPNIRGVRHFVKIDDIIISITLNGCLYQTRTCSDLGQETKLSSQLLDENLFHAAELMERLAEEVSDKESLVNALKLYEPNISKNIHVIEEEGKIVIRNKTEYLFKKRVWKVLIETEDFERKHLELKELETDIVPGGSVTFKYSENMANTITLISDVITFELQVEYDRNKTENDPELNKILSFLNTRCIYLY